MSVDALIRKALDAGVELALVDGRIKVTGHRAKVNEWRDQLRTHKAEIYRHLTAANDPEPPQDPAAWRELAQAYHLHHVNCSTCCSAGQGRGLRCGTGAALWTNYQNA
ncbi:hypothetical protein SBP18_14410 [Rhodoferax ferrireducens]|uniref:hypothetical protein n=1 Tax=Rhodoferax ferrireducens TaxID=192843 RepID=UPI00298D94FB|nr:hypothetical protein [Rhodoferax ferrireducens]WPC65676.1 hypothetical protein SBP18_14410 [Rhodoferax ferrireducens]